MSADGIPSFTIKECPYTFIPVLLFNLSVTSVTLSSLYKQAVVPILNKSSSTVVRNYGSISLQNHSPRVFNALSTIIYLFLNISLTNLSMFSVNIILFQLIYLLFYIRLVLKDKLIQFISIQAMLLTQFLIRCYSENSAILVFTLVMLIPFITPWLQSCPCSYPRYPFFLLCYYVWCSRRSQFMTPVR